MCDLSPAVVSAVLDTFGLGRKIYDEIAARLPVPLAADALDDALARLKLVDEAALMEAIARRTITDEEVMEALMPGSVDAEAIHALPPQSTAISIKDGKSTRLNSRHSCANRMPSSACKNQRH